MFFEIPRKELINPLKTVVSVVDNKQTLAVLSNVLIKLEGNQLQLVGTDSEVEITCMLPVENSLNPDDNNGETTLPARKFFDIVRTLEDKNPVQIQVNNSRATIKSGKSRFTLACLPAEDFPLSPAMSEMYTFQLPQKTLKELIAQTAFAIANNDVRYYLNGLCLDLKQDKLVAVATDGHRLALAETTFALQDKTPFQVIVPKKVITELNRLLSDDDDEVSISLDDNHIKIVLSPHLTISSKLIDGKFPDYEGVLPLNPDKVMVAPVSKLKSTLTQSAILSNEKYRGVKLLLEDNLLKVSARNPDQEEAEVECEVEYVGETLEISFNVNYLQDVLTVLPTAEVELCFKDNNSSCLMRPKAIDTAKFVVMPMRL